MDKDEALTIETPEILRRKYRFIRQIGEGANGITYLAVERVSGEKVAVKQLKKVDDFKSFDLFRREVETMKSVDIDGVPKYIDYIERSGSLDDYYLVQEYIDNRSSNTSKISIKMERQSASISFGILRSACFRY